jgi:hypothetical protein
MNAAIGAVAAITAASGLLVVLRMPETHRPAPRGGGWIGRRHPGPAR